MATDLPSSDSDPLLSKVMREGPSHFAIIVSSAVFPWLPAFLKEAQSISTRLHEHLKKYLLIRRKENRA